MSRKKYNPAEIINKIYLELDNGTTLNKIFAILNTIRNGNYYNFSNDRTALLNEFSRLMDHLSDDELKEFKYYMTVPQLFSLLEDRERQNIAYTTLTKLIELSSKRDIEIYDRYEHLIMHLNADGKARYIEYLFGLFEIKWALDKDIDSLEDYYFKKFCMHHIYWCDVYKLSKLTMRIKQVDRRKMLQYIINAKSISNSTNVIDFFVRCHPELKRYLILM